MVTNKERRLEVMRRWALALKEARPDLTQIVSTQDDRDAVFLVSIIASLFEFGDNDLRPEVLKRLVGSVRRDGRQLGIADAESLVSAYCERYQRAVDDEERDSSASLLVGLLRIFVDEKFGELVPAKVEEVLALYTGGTGQGLGAAGVLTKLNEAVGRPLGKFGDTTVKDAKKADKAAR